MPDEPPATNETFDRLSGGQGDEVQFEWMAAFVKQYVRWKMGAIQFIPADGVAVIGGNNPLIFVP